MTPLYPLEGVVSWNMNTTCNYRCSYCTQRFVDDRGQWARDLPRFLAALLALPGDWEIKLSGGEPFRHPGFLDAVAALVTGGRRVSVVTNLSAPRDELAAYCEAVRPRPGVLSASLHLEYVTVDEFRDTLRWVADRHAGRVVATCVATRANLPRLAGLRDDLRAAGLDLFVQPEKQDRDVIDYDDGERAQLVTLGGHNGTGAIEPSFEGRPCWAGARYLIVDHTGEAYRCYPSRRHRAERLGNLLDGTLRLHTGATPCRYAYCNCTVPQQRGMVDTRELVMPLAGSIKLRTFLLVAAATVGLASFALWRACRDDGKAPEQATGVPRTVVDVDAGAVARAPDAAPPAPVDHNTFGAREHDAIVLRYRTRDLGTDKLKDVTKGKPYKVNVYQDAGKPTANRAKVDLDRDDKFDEKYTFDGDTITLQRAPADDEVYTETYTWTGDGWVNPGAEGAPRQPVPPGATLEGGVDLASRAHDAEVLGYRGKALGTDKLKDVSKGRGWKINVYQDAGKPTANRAKVDLDRDDKFDEKYTFDGDTVTLERAPADDEVYTETYHWTGDGWATAR